MGEGSFSTQGWVIRYLSLDLVSDGSGVHDLNRSYVWGVGTLMDSLVKALHFPWFFYSLVDHLPSPSFLGSTRFFVLFELVSTSVH